MDTIIHNATIITLDGSRPRAQALAIRQGHIAALGSDDDILALAQPHTRRINAGGAALIPGLVDAHIHWEWTTRALSGVDLFNVGKDEALARVAQAAQGLAEGDWLLGYGWSHGTWGDGAFPNAAELDAIAPHCKAYLMARSGHAAWVNSAALRAAGIGLHTPDPDGGQIVRDSQGQPTGILLETAMKLIHPFADSPQQMAQLMRRTQEAALAQGLTGFHDYDNPSCMAALQIMREEGALALRVVKQINQPWLEAALSLGIRSGYGDDWIKFGGLKLFADGALGARTALMVEPYEGEPHNRGLVVVPKETMLALVERATLNGLSSTIHAIGDQAVRDVLDVYAHARQIEAQAGIPRAQRRHRAPARQPKLILQKGDQRLRQRDHRCNRRDEQQKEPQRAQHPTQRHKLKHGRHGREPQIESALRGNHLRRGNPEKGRCRGNRNRATQDHFGELVGGSGRKPRQRDIVLLAQVGSVALNRPHAQAEREENLSRRRQPDLRIQQHKHLAPVALDVPFRLPQKRQPVQRSQRLRNRMPQREHPKRQHNRQHKQQRHPHLRQSLDTPRDAPRQHKQTKREHPKKHQVREQRRPKHIAHRLPL